MANGRKWSEQETATARRLLADQAGDAEFRQTLGRSKQSAISHLNRKGVETGNYQPQVADRINIPAEVIAAAVKRAQAPTTFTGSIFGDPPIGYSALDVRL
jgi:hypothetical protein